LVGKVPLEDMQNRMVIICSNLKPAKMRGIMSEAMVMCASEDGKVEVIDPPAGAVPGDIVTVPGFSAADKPPDAMIKKHKKNGYLFDDIAPDLKTDAAGLACYKGVPWEVAGKGNCSAKSMFNTHVR
jgi:tRNA-binding EMAP/Myf-like protein